MRARNARIAALFANIIGFDCETYHKSCEHYRSTLFVAKCSKGYVFGGYTTLAYSIQPTRDPSGWIFTLTNPYNRPTKFSSDKMNQMVSRQYQGKVKRIPSGVCALRAQYPIGKSGTRYVRFAAIVYCVERTVHDARPYVRLARTCFLTSAYNAQSEYIHNA